MGNNQQKNCDNRKGNRPILDKEAGDNTNSDRYIFLPKLGKILVDKSFEEEKINGITENIFQKYLFKCSRITGLKLYKYFLLKYYHKNEAQTTMETENILKNKVLSLDGFVEEASELLDCLNDSQQLEYYINAYANGKEEMAYSEIYDLLVSAYEITHFSLPGEMTENLLQSITKSIMHEKENNSTKYIFNWVCQHTPRLLFGLHRYFCQVLGLSYSTIPLGIDIQEDSVEIPVLHCAPRSSCATLYPGLMWMLSCSLPQLFLQALTPPSAPTSPTEECMSSREIHSYIGKLKTANNLSSWISLFNSNEHGLSINRFQHHVFDYRGPTLLFIKADDNSLFCVAADTEWRDSKLFYGGNDCLCLQILPEYKVIERGTNMLYFNISARGLPVGLQVGTDYKNRTLSFDKDMDVFYFRQIPYKLQTLEVWGCGANDIKESQSESKKQAYQDAENRQKVKLDGENWSDNPDRYLLELSGTGPNYVKYEKDTQSPT